MWILPKNYQLSSRFVQDMVVSKEDLTLPGLNIESSLMWRSKPSALRTWLTRWKPTSYLPHLFTRVLKPCQWSRFEAELTSSLAAIHVNLSQQQESDSEKKTPDTFGLTSEKSSGQLDLLDVSLKMSKDTSALDCEKSLATWKALVTKQRGEYSQRVKSALRTSASESTSWPTPSAHEARLGYQDRSDPTKKGTQESLTTVIVNKAGGRSVCAGHLNPDWVEWLMGVPTGWTELGSWGMVSCQQQPPKHG